MAEEKKLSGMTKFAGQFFVLKDSNKRFYTGIYSDRKFVQKIRGKIIAIVRKLVHHVGGVRMRALI